MIKSIFGTPASSLENLFLATSDAANNQSGNKARFLNSSVSNAESMNNIFTASRPYIGTQLDGGTDRLVTSHTDSLESLVTKNTPSPEKTLQFYDSIIENKTKELPKKILNKRYLLASAIISAIVTVASFSISIAVASIPLGVIIALSLICTAGSVALMFSIMKHEEKIGDIKATEDQILVAKILKEIYSVDEIAQSVNDKDEYFHRLFQITNEFLRGRIPARRIKSKELLFTLRNPSTTNEDVSNALKVTLGKFAFLLSPVKFTESEAYCDGELSKHIELFVKNHSAKERLVKVLCNSSTE